MTKRNIALLLGLLIYIGGLLWLLWIGERWSLLFALGSGIIAAPFIVALLTGRDD